MQRHGNTPLQCEPSRPILLGIHRQAAGAEERRRAKYQVSIQSRFVEAYMLTHTCHINLELKKEKIWKKEAFEK